MSKEKISETKTLLQERAEKNRILREEARKNRASVGVKTDAKIGFTDLPHDVRLAYFKKHEERWKQRISGNKQPQFGESYTLTRG